MLMIFFDIKGIVDIEFALAGQTVNSAYCYDILRRLRKNVRKLHLELWRQKNWALHQDNAPSHSLFFTREFLTRNNMAVVSFYPLSRLEMKLKGRHFVTVEVIKAVLNTLTERDFQGAVRKWAEAQGTVHTCGRGLFEGDSGQ
jgi:hypothetical protein